jgi:tetratricopeptide (TPR) repeat protein
MTPLEDAINAYNTAWDLAEGGDFAAALVAYEDVVDRYRDTPPGGRLDIPLDAQIGLSRALGELGRIEEGVAALDDALTWWGDEPDAPPGVRESLAGAFDLKGIMLCDLGRITEALDAFDEAVARFGGDADAGVAQMIAQALESKAYVLQDEERAEEALDAFATLLAYDGEPDGELRFLRVAQARAARASLLLDLGRPEEALADYDAAIADGDGGHDDPYLARWIVEAWCGRAFCLSEQEHWDEAIAACDAGLAAAEGLDVEGAALRVARTMYNKAGSLHALRRHADELAVLEALDARFAADDDPEVRQEVLDGLVKRIATLVHLARDEEAIAVCDALVARYGDATDVATRAEVAYACRERARALEVLSRFDDAIAAYRDTLMRFGADEATDVRRPVLEAMVGLAWRLIQRDDVAEGLVMLDAYLDGASADPAAADVTNVAWALMQKGTALQDLERHGEALAAYDELIGWLDGTTDVPGRAQRVIALMRRAEMLTALDRAGEVAENERSLVAAAGDEVADVFAALAADLGSRDDPQARIQRAELSVQEASVHRARGEDDTARDLLEAVVERFGDDTLPDVRRAVAAARDQLDELGGPDVL